MLIRILSASMLLVAAAVLSGCMAHSARIDYTRSGLHMMVSAETQALTGNVLTPEEELQAEVDRLLALKPAEATPRKLVLYEMPSAGRSEIESPRQWISLRKSTSATMKGALEETGLFEEVDFLPDILLPATGVKDLATLRIAAARAHADGVLIYSTEAGYEYKPNALAVFYPTIIGLFVAPGSQAASTALSKAVLLDVRTGYIHMVLETYGEAGGSAIPYAYIDQAKLEVDARTDSIADLSGRVAEKARLLNE